MKRLICLLLAVIILTSFFGCTKKNDEMINPVKTFYCKNDVEYNTDDGVLDSEVRELADYKNNLLKFMNQYLKGPESEDLYAPFPAGSRILELTRSGKSAYVILSTHFSLLSGFELIVSCACISRTIMDITGCQEVRLHIDGTQEIESAEIVMSWDKLLLVDSAEIR